MSHHPDLQPAVAAARIAERTRPVSADRRTTRALRRHRAAQRLRAAADRLDA